MSVIVPDEVLEVLKCSICKSYLSYEYTRNIKIHAYSSAVICGRCSLKNEYVALSLFNEVAKYLLFPYVHRYEGCNQLLQYEKVMQHEKICRGQGIIYSCPLCPDKYPPDTLLKFIDHFHENHKFFVLHEPLLKINLKQFKANYFLYCENVKNYLFLIYVDCAKDRVLVNASVAGKKSDQVKQSLNLVDEQRFCTDFNDNSEVFELKTIENMEFLTCKFRFEILSVPAPILFDYSKPMELSTPCLERFPKIIVDKKLMAQYGNTQPEFKMSKCLKKLESPIYKTSVNITCDFCENYFWDCKFTVELNVCKYGVCIICYEYSRSISGFKCFKHQQDFEERNTYHQIDDVYFHCRYNCGSFFKIWVLQKHEKKCGNFSEELYVMEKFGIVKKAREYFVKGNCIRPRSTSYLNKETWYVVTHSGQRCQVNVEVDGRVFNIKVNHEYDKSRYYIRARIYENREVKTEINEFRVVGQREAGSGYMHCTNPFIAIFLEEIITKPVTIV